jgi:hypothetical protein
MVVMLGPQNNDIPYYRPESRRGSCIKAKKESLWGHRGQL